VQYDADDERSDECKRKRCAFPLTGHLARTSNCRAITMR
jgi:hypothetical protein